MKKALPYLFTVLSVFAEAPVQEKIKLEYKFEPGKSYLYAQSMEIDMEMNNPMTQEKMKMETEMDQDFTFTAGDHEKGVKVDMTFDKFAMKTGSNGVAMMEFDSTAEGNEGNPMAKMFEPLLNMNCYTIYDNTGKPLEFGGLENMAGLEQMGMDPEQFEKTFSQAYEMMPKEPVAVGDTWEQTQEIPMGKMGGDMKIAIVNKLEAIEELDGHKVAKISYTADLDMTASLGEENKESPISIKTNKFEGTYWHDLELNMTRKSTLSSSMVLGAPEGAEVGENGMGEIPYDMEMVQTLKEVK